MVLELRDSTDQLVRAAGSRYRQGGSESPGRGQYGNQQTETLQGGGKSPGGQSRSWEEQDPPFLVKGLQGRAEGHGGGRDDKDGATSQSQQGGWMSSGSVTDRPLSLSDLWKIPQARISFLIRSTYDTLPCSRNLHKWLGAEKTCPLCSTINASLQHILSG